MAMIDLNDELAQDYLADCREHLAAIEADLFLWRWAEHKPVRLS